MTMIKEITEERTRCGTCCQNGGPALHGEDLARVRSGAISLDNLLTIRQGELVFKPHGSIPEAASREFVKLCGKPGSWACVHYRSEGCGIYSERPLACRVLKCWDTQAIEDLVEVDTLTRFDILDPDDPVRELIVLHEVRCPSPDFQLMQRLLPGKLSVEVEELERLINLDLELRGQAMTALCLSVSREMFCFGRPLFQLVKQLGIQVVEYQGQLKVIFDGQ